jgi:DNA-directed RNA polymerase specialized sigma24 family protein
VIAEGFAVSHGSGVPGRREPGRTNCWAHAPAKAIRHEPNGTQGPTSWTPARPTIDPPLALGREDSCRRTQYRAAASPACQQADQWGERSVTEGPSEAFALFFKHNSGPVFRALLAGTGDRDAAEDATAEAFARAFAHWDSVAVHPNPRAWVLRVAWNCYRSSWRKWQSRWSADPPEATPSTPKTLERPRPGRRDPRSSPTPTRGHRARRAWRTHAHTGRSSPGEARRHGPQPPVSGPCRSSPGT